MLDPNRYALNAATVGFRKRMKQSVDWDSFNKSLQTQTESVKVRRELEETPVSEIHVMGGQLYGIGGNQKTNEAALQARQMNGYPLRSFLVTGGPIILPPKRSEGVMAIPINRGLPQYTQYNGVIGNYASSFTEPLHAPMESGQVLLARAGIQAKSDSIVNPYKALQFQLNMHKSQQEITDLEERHQQLRAFNQEGLIKSSMDAQNSQLSKSHRQRITQAAGAASTKALITPAQLRQGKKGLKRTRNPMRDAVTEMIDPEVITGPRPRTPASAITRTPASDSSYQSRAYYYEEEQEEPGSEPSGASYLEDLSGYLDFLNQSAGAVFSDEERRLVGDLKEIYPEIDPDFVELKFIENGRDFNTTYLQMEEVFADLRQKDIERQALQLQPNSIVEMSSITGIGSIWDEDSFASANVSMDPGARGIFSNVENLIASEARSMNQTMLRAHNGKSFSMGDLNSPPSAGTLTDRASSIRISGTPRDVDMSPLGTVNLFTP